MFYFEIFFSKSCPAEDVLIRTETVHAHKTFYFFKIGKAEEAPLEMPLTECKQFLKGGEVAAVPIRGPTDFGCLIPVVFNGVTLKPCLSLIFVNSA
jgi:hypothetical protein